MTIRNWGMMLLITASAGVVKAQTIVKKKFELPRNADYAPGRLLAKIKDAYKAEFTQNQSARIQSLPVRSMKPMVQPGAAKKSAAWKGPTARAAAPAVDISLYFTISFDPKLDIEKYINELYATDLFDIIEPAYAYYQDYTPNDTQVSSQYHLAAINAYKAWDIQKGSDEVLITFVDSGGDLDHPDLAANIYVNQAEYPPDGTDNDGNGFIDDWRGWDFVGADTLNVTNPAFTGDNDPSTFVTGDGSHGTWASGCAGAVTDNGIGVAGVGFNTKIMYTKHAADNQLPGKGAIYFGYDGILYAANHLPELRKVINCSWGGGTASQIFQDLINHVTLDLGCLVIASAGNGGTAAPSYPAAYDNVVSVAATDSKDVAATFTTFGPTIDLSAPGLNIYTTGYNNIYSVVSGTSFSSPITAGAAALVWAKNPGWTPRQVAEQLRVSSNATALYTANPSRIGQLGFGRLDVYNALVSSLPSIRASNPVFADANGNPVQLGEKGYLTMDFTNYLSPTSSGLQISVTVKSTYGVVSKGVITPGAIGTNETINNSVTPFEIAVGLTAPENTPLTFVITYKDGTYTDSESITVIINPSYYNVNSNQINTTVTAIGRLGYEDTANSAEGVGFVFNDNQLAFEIGLMIGNSTGTILYNNVRGVGSVFDQDFTSLVKINKIVPGLRSDAEISGEFSNDATVSKRVVTVDYRSLVWKDVPYDKFVIMEYKLTNSGTTPQNNFYFGVFADWDISVGGANDAADWFPGEKLGYVYPAVSQAKPYAGIQLLTSSAPPNYYAIDNDPTVAGTPFGLYDGFTDAEKGTTLSTQRLKAGQSSTSGNDVSHVISTGPYNLNAGASMTIAFAFHATPDLNTLKTSASYADSIYNYTLTAPKPVVDTVDICFNSAAQIQATGATKLNWYKTFTGGTPFFTGSSFLTGALQHDTIFYISNADHSYESVRTAAVVRVKANPLISSSGAPAICQGSSITLSVADADSYAWSNGATTKTTTVNTAGSFTVTVTDSKLHCSSTSAPFTTTVMPTPVANFITSGQLFTKTPITFTDQSTDAVTWAWNFGDNTRSTIENPTHSYTSIKNYQVSLTVAGSDGCADSVSHTISVITGLEDKETGISVYPNPVKDQPLIVEVQELPGTPVALSLVSMLDVAYYKEEVEATGDKIHREIPMTNLSDGVYILKIKAGERIIVRKIIRTR